MRHGDIEWVVECPITFSKAHMKVSNHHMDIEKLLSKYEKVFGDLTRGRTLDIGADHTIELEIVIQPIKMHPYRIPKMIQDEIEESIK